MNRLGAITLILALSSRAGFAQDPVAAQQQRAMDEQARLDREASFKSMNDFLTDSRDAISKANKAAETSRERAVRAQREALIDAYVEFRRGQIELSDSLGLQAKLKVPAQRIEKSTTTFLKFVRSSTGTRQRVDVSEFNAYTEKELGWETLSSVERLSSVLFAVLLNETATTVDIRYIPSMSKLESDLLRLQWLTRKLK